MQKRVLLLFILTLVPRIWRLGEVPAGLSPKEVGLGLSLAASWGVWLTPALLRLPFVLLGVLQVLLLYALVKRIGLTEKFSFTAALFLTFMPWHIQMSRVYSLGVVVIFVALVGLILVKRRLAFDKKRTFYGALLLSILVFLLSIFRITEEARFRVDEQRKIAVQLEAPLPLQPVSNKLIESYRYRQSLLFENLDFGNYFFAGHPRQRWGIEEIQKLLVFSLPLVIIGAFKLQARAALFASSWAALALSIVVFFGARGPDLTLLFAIPFSLLGAAGLLYLNKEHKKLLYLLLLLLSLELVSFYKAYMTGITEGLFSPRRAVYEELVEQTMKEGSPDEQVLVSSRLGDPEPYFKFYSRSLDLPNYTFRTFDIRKERNAAHLFVDVLPDDAGPSEPLYSEKGWPPFINILATFYDKGRRQTVLIYKVR